MLLIISRANTMNKSLINKFPNKITISNQMFPTISKVIKAK